MTQCELWADNNDMNADIPTYSNKLNLYLSETSETYDWGMVAETATEYDKNI